ncbi:membrane protein, partial [Streptomyces viridochromogenes]
VVRWAVTAGTAVLVAGCWPYFDVFALAGDSSVDGIHRRLYEDLGGQFWLALLGLPALWLRWRRGSWRDPLVLLFALDCLVVAYGWVSGHYTYGRILGLALVPSQFALAVELAAPRPWVRARRVLGAAAATGACVGLLTVQGGAVVPRVLDPIGLEQPSHWPSYAWVARHVGKGEVVISDGHFAPRSLPGYGPNLAAPIWPDPALDERERERRLADVRAYLSPASTHAGRTAVARRYHARWLLLTRWKRVPEEAVVVAWSRETGEVLARIG